MSHPTNTSTRSPRLSHSPDMTHQRLDEELQDLEDGKMSVEMREKNEEKMGVEFVPHEKKPMDNSWKGRLLTLKEVLFGNKLNILLICIPFGYVFFSDVYSGARFLERKIFAHFILVSCYASYTIFSLIRFVLFLL